VNDTVVSDTNLRLQPGEHIVKVGKKVFTRLLLRPDQWRLLSHSQTFLGTLLGGIIGFERQTHGRPAGFRTQLLVCVSCVLLMIISEGYYADSGQAGLMRIDPTRIAAGAMTGVGFLGAGVILKSGASVQGLTTAACVWIVSAIGLAIGAGQYVAAIVGFVITFVSLGSCGFSKRECRERSICFRP
jgi:putative Mg2+ transporter-C (MgtC) family protein